MRQSLSLLLNIFVFGLVDATTFYLSGPKVAKAISSKPTPVTPAPMPVMAPSPTATKPTVTQFKTKKSGDKRRMFGSGFGQDSASEETLGGGL
jgi:hypothetical protein